MQQRYTASSFRDPSLTRRKPSGTEEDNLCAEYIKSLLEGTPLPDIYQQMADLKHTSGAKFFDPAQNHIFPQRDFELCVELNTVPFVLRLKKDPEGLDYMERVDV